MCGGVGRLKGDRVTGHVCCRFLSYICGWVRLSSFPASRVCNRQYHHHIQRSLRLVSPQRVEDVGGVGAVGVGGVEGEGALREDARRFGRGVVGAWVGGFVCGSCVINK